MTRFKATRGRFGAEVRRCNGDGYPFALLQIRQDIWRGGLYLDWGRDCAEATQLAVALLAAVLDDRILVRSLVAAFRPYVVALPSEGWTLTRQQVMAAILHAEHEAEAW